MPYKNENNNLHYIYILYDPRKKSEPHNIYEELKNILGDDGICTVTPPKEFFHESYIGHTKHLKRRYCDHICVQDDDTTRRGYWIKKLCKESIKPIMQPIVIIDTTKVEPELKQDLVDALERDVIRMFREINRAEKNLADGGGGGMTPEVARKINEQLGEEGRKLRAQKGHETLGHEGRRLRAKKGANTLGEEGQKLKGKKISETTNAKGFEANSARSKQAMATMGPEGLKARSQKVAYNMTPEQKRERAIKSAATLLKKSGSNLPTGIALTKSGKYRVRVGIPRKDLGVYLTLDAAIKAVEEYNKDPENFVSNKRVKTLPKGMCLVKGRFMVYGKNNVYLGMRSTQEQAQKLLKEYYSKQINTQKPSNENNEKEEIFKFG